MKRVLFICAENAARSQIAEGLLRHYTSDRFLPASAGTFPSEAHALATETMRDPGIDISQYRSKSVFDPEINEAPCLEM